MSKRKSKDACMKPSKSPRLKRSFTTEEEKLTIAWAEMRQSEASEVRGTEETIVEAIESDERLVVCRRERKTGEYKNLRRIMRNIDIASRSLSSERDNTGVCFSSKAIKSVYVPNYSKMGSAEKVSNFPALTNFDNLVTSFDLDFSALWKAYVESSKFVVENVFLCSVAAITFEYICYPDRLRPEKSYAMETDYKRARTLCFVDVMSVIFSMYIIYIVVFSFGVSPYLLCDFALAKEMSAKRRIYSHWLLMVFFLGFISLLCWFAT